MNPITLRAMTFGSATAPKTSQKAAPVQFGMIELGRDEYKKAKKLYDAGVALAKAGRAEAAKQALLDSFDAYDSLHTRLKIITAFAEGIGTGDENDTQQPRSTVSVRPRLGEVFEDYQRPRLADEDETNASESNHSGLPPNPAKAAELLERLLAPKTQTYQTYRDGQPKTVTRYDLLFGDEELLAKTAVKLAPYDPKFQQVAIDIIKNKGGNEYGTAKNAQFLAGIGALDEACALLTEYFNRQGQQRQELGRSAQYANMPYAIPNIDRERLYMARLVGGLESVPGGASNSTNLSIPEIADGEKAAEMLKEIAGQTQSADIKREILLILATGEGQIPQDKEAAKRIIDSL